MQIEELLAYIQPHFYKRANTKWNGLKTPAEDVVQEALLRLYQLKDKIPDVPEKRFAYCQSVFDIVCKQIYQAEHLQLQWSEQLFDGTIDKTTLKTTITCVQDNYLDDLRNRHNQYSRNYYYKHKEHCIEYVNNYRKEHIEEVKKYLREYRKQNREKLKDYQRKYHAEHKEELQNNRRKYNEEHIDELREYRRKYYNEHIDEIREYRRNYYANNKEYFKEHKKQWVKENKERMQYYNVKSRKYHADYSAKRYKKIKELQEEIFEEYGIKLYVKDVTKLFIARNKSEEEYKNLLHEYIE